jgi:DNA-binding CsgD family transcriptional regulator
MALAEATTGEAHARAVFRLLLATVQGEYAAAHFHAVASPQHQWGTWFASNGSTMTDEQLRAIDKAANGYPWLTAQLKAGNLTRVMLTRWALPPEEELLRSAYYELFMKAYNWRYALVVFLWRKTSPPVMGSVFSLFRRAEQPDFSDEEVSRVEAIYGEIERAAQRVARLEEERAALCVLESLIRDLPLPSILLSWDLRPKFHNRPASESCTIWRCGAGARAVKDDGFELPAEVLAACTEMKDEWKRSLARHNLRRLVTERTVEHTNSRLLTANIRMMRSETTPLADPSFLITFEAKSSAGPHLRVSLETAFAALNRLSPREREIAMLCSEGKTNTEIADTLGRSVGTIKAQLHSVFKELGVRTRTELAMMLQRV